MQKDDMFFYLSDSTETDQKVVQIIWKIPHYQKYKFPACKAGRGDMGWDT